MLFKGEVMKKLLLGVLMILILSGCYRNYGIKVGMKVTNGYCTGNVACIYTSLEQARILDPECGGHSYNFVDLPLEDLKELL
jgi:hypothetical protein